MKLLFKILFSLLTIFHTNVVEAKISVFGLVASETEFAYDVVENETTVASILENDIEINCKSESDLLDYRHRAVGATSKATKGAPKYLYHYTSKEAAQSISQQGLKVGKDGFSYLTNKGNLSSLQAQIELALPANRALPNSILRIDASGLNPALIRRVSGNLPGYGARGGTEFLFNQHIPANLIKVIK